MRNLQGDIKNVSEAGWRTAREEFFLKTSQKNLTKPVVFTKPTNKIPASIGLLWPLEAAFFDATALRTLLNSMVFYPVSAYNC